MANPIELDNDDRAVPFLRPQRSASEIARQMVYWDEHSERDIVEATVVRSFVDDPDSVGGRTAFEGLFGLPLSEVNNNDIIVDAVEFLVQDHKLKMDVGRNYAAFQWKLVDAVRRDELSKEGAKASERLPEILT